jgi:hypothetical protein
MMQDTHIKPQTSLSEMLIKLRKNEAEIPSLDEITEEVETVRQTRYAKKASHQVRSTVI